MPEAPKILIVGAAGRFAGLVVPALAQRGIRPVGLVRSQAQADAARRNGAADVVLGDLRDHASLKAALEGIDRAFYISPVFQEDEAEMGIGFVEAAKGAGVSRIVLSTLIRPSLELRNHASKRPIENALFKSGLSYTLLRPAVLYQNLAAGWPVVLESGLLAEPFSSQARIARVDYRDVAEVAAIALTEEKLLNGSFELSADGGKSREEVAAIASQVSKRAIEAAAPSFDEWAAKAKPPYDDRQMRQLAAMYAHYDAHGLLANPFTLQAILGREPRSMHAFFADLMAGRPVTAS